MGRDTALGSVQVCETQCRCRDRALKSVQVSWRVKALHVMQVCGRPQTGGSEYMGSAKTPPIGGGGNRFSGDMKASELMQKSTSR